MPGYQCRNCGEWHADAPLHYGAPAPSLWYTIPPAERQERALLSPDLCLIDALHGFIMGNLEIPIIDSQQVFSWDVWVSLSLDHFNRAYELWEQPERESEPPYFGWLSTLLPGYPDTLNIKTMVHTRKIGCRPRIELESTDHPLAIEQRQGITLERVQEIAELMIHPPA